MFLELVDSMLPHSVPTDEEILDIFRILTKFFADNKEPSDNELIGIYAEIDAIVSLFPTINLADYWQSKDRLKFDFSFSDSKKLEVKATTKSFRTHHFRHEQLNTDNFSVVVLSYMLRHDDEGKSLLDLLYEVKPLLITNPQKLARVNLILKNVSETRLGTIKFNPEYTAEKKHYYDARFIPKFTEETPDGIANAQYDCSLENIKYMSEVEFIAWANQAISEEKHNGSYE